MSVPFWAFAAACMAGVIAALYAACMRWDLDTADRTIDNLQQGNRVQRDLTQAATARAKTAERLRGEDRERNG